MKKKFEDKKDGIEPDSNPDEITIGDKDSMKPDECEPAETVSKTKSDSEKHDDKLKWTLPELLMMDGAYTTYGDTDRLTFVDDWPTTHSTSGDVAKYLDRIPTPDGSTWSMSESITHHALGCHYGKATNRYWLATLPPDKLAAYFACTTNCDRCKFCHDPYNCADGANCEKGIKLWLEEKYKDETEDE